jgi:hypothetical protein
LPRATSTRGSWRRPPTSCGGSKHHQQIADHVCLSFFVEFDNAQRLKIVKGHLHHSHGAVDDLAAGGDDGLCLLPLEHRAGDFLCIGQMADPRLDHLDAGLVQAVLNLRAQFLGNRLGIAAQCDFIVAVGLIGVTGGQIAQGGF